MDSAAAATAPTQDALLPPAYYRAFAADTHSVFIFQSLGSFLSRENYNGYELQLSTSAYERARALLETASNTMTLLVPEFTPDGDGGIDIEWENEGRRLALNVSASGEGDFISWREPHGRYEGEPATSDLLIDKLVWLTR